jgi:hypothetical protein
MKFFSTLAAAALVAFAPVAALANITIGTQLTGQMDRSLSSNHVQVGDTFVLTNVHSANNNINGARVYGHVADVQKAGQGTPGKISLAYDRLVTRSGNSYAISGSTVNAQVNTKSNALKEAGGAVVGMIVGNYIGKHVGGIASSLGGVIGGAGGYLAAKNNRENVEIPPKAAVTLQVTRARPQAR